MYRRYYIAPYVMYHCYMVESTSISTAPARARILDAAVTLLRQSPTGDISTRAVCEAAAIKQPTLYHHFGDKSGLLHAAVQAGFEQYLDRKRAVPSGGDPLVELRRGWDMHVEFGLQNPTLYALMYDQPQRRRSSPAAVTARRELELVVAAIEAGGRLRVPIGVAVETLEAAGVGTTLQLIRSGLTSPDAASVIIRDAVTEAVVSPATVSTAAPASPQVAQAAAELRAALTGRPLAGLRATEVALLRDWLKELAAGEFGEIQPLGTAG